MPFIEKYYNKDGDEIDTFAMKFEINLDEVDSCNNVQLILRPLDPTIVMTRKYYERDVETDPHVFETFKSFKTNFFYNDEDDKIFLNVFNGFDVAIFNICSLLGIGRLELRDEVPYNENGFAPVHDKVSTITWTLEEFKQLDGFVAMFKFTPHFILFKGLLIGANYIHRDVCEGSIVPFFLSDELLRGENLFKWD